MIPHALPTSFLPLLKIPDMEEIKETIRLTQFSKGAGCGCKIAPAVLEQILQGSATSPDPNLLVGYGSRDDAAVYDTGNPEALISTTDFFTPIVDDPYDFGRIAAANAISDVYAMGGKPLMALAILGWPVEKLSPLLAREVLNGARAVCAEAGIPLAGGHSIDTVEPVFGLAVSGTVRKEQIKRNDTVKAGDLLFLTKPLGTGIFSTALKRELLKPGEYEQLIEVMTRLNKAGEKIAALAGVHAMTDVTGFGLAGHLLEMLGQGNCSAEVEYAAVPRIDGVDDYISRFIYPDNTTRNYAAYSKEIKGMDGTEFFLLCDPQTSGGLLIAVDPASEQELIGVLRANGAPVHKIGHITPRAEQAIWFKH
jgi:selenide,water dikinase